MALKSLTFTCPCARSHLDALFKKSIALVICVVRYYAGTNDVSIEMTNHPLPLPPSYRSKDDMDTNIYIAFTISYNVAFGMSFLIATFVNFLISVSSLL